MIYVLYHIFLRKLRIGSNTPRLSVSFFNMSYSFFHFSYSFFILTTSFLSFYLNLRTYLGKEVPTPYANTISIRRKANLQYIFSKRLDKKSKRKPFALLDYLSTIFLIFISWAENICIWLPNQLSLFFYYYLVPLTLIAYLMDCFQA